MSTPRGATVVGRAAFSFTTPASAVLTSVRCSGLTSTTRRTRGGNSWTIGAVARFDAAHDLRLVERAAVGERRVRQSELEHRDGGRALTDRREQREAAAERLLVAPRVPAARRHAAARFGVHADAGLDAEAEIEADRGKPIHADARAELVEVDVARLHDRFVQVRPPVHARAAKEALAVLEAAAAIDVGARVDEPVGERRRAR